MVAQAGAPLHFELYTEEDDVNYIRWKWISRKEAHRVLRGIDATLLKRSGLHDALWMDWARPEEGKPLEVTGAFLYILKNKIDPADEDEDLDWAVYFKEKIREEIRTCKKQMQASGKRKVKPMCIGIVVLHIRTEDLRPGRHQDRPDPTDIPSSSSPSSSPGCRKQASPTRAVRHHSLESSPRGAPSTLSDHNIRSGSPSSPDREEPDDNEPLVGFGSPMVPYTPSDDEQVEAVAVLTSLAASDPSPASKGKRPVLHRSSSESEKIRFVMRNRVKRRVADLDDDARGPVSQQVEAVHPRPFDPFKIAKKNENYLGMVLQPFLDKFRGHKGDGISYVQVNWQAAQAQDPIASLAGYWAPMDERDEDFL
ncbi:hypothetical protein R1sor_026543 [Riccia sorocarpa]|uniref:Uncharacterized protein n=1 Tax=Riccia sorocarpa TaxID=122646 RepID=A0ABD3GET8_9MARC